MSERHCTTCADEAVPMRVYAFEDVGIARCLDALGRGVAVQVDLVADAIAVGDVLLVHAGTALARLSKRPEGAR